MPLSRDGPYLLAAFLCEKVLREQDGVMSFIRVVDRITHRFAASTLPDSMPPVPVNPTVIVLFKAGSARGRHTVTIRLIDVSGMATTVSVTQPVLFESEDRGVYVIASLSLVLEREGIYWFEVLLDDEFVTRTPLRLVYQPVLTTTG